MIYIYIYIYIYDISRLRVKEGPTGCGRVAGRLRLKCDGTRAETRFRLSAKRTSLFKPAGGVSSVDYWQRCAHQR